MVGTRLDTNKYICDILARLKYKWVIPLLTIEKNIMKLVNSNNKNQKFSKLTQHD